MGPNIRYDAGPATDDLADGSRIAGQATDGRSRGSADLPARRAILMYNGTATTIAIYQSVALDIATAGYVAGKWCKITATAADSPYCGNATEEILGGDWGMVEVGSGIGRAYVTDATAADAHLRVSTAQTGELEAGTLGAANTQIVGYTLEAEGATIEDTALCWFY
jgi:hypothetical protein